MHGAPAHDNKITINSYIYRLIEQDSKAVLSDLTKSPIDEATASTTTGTTNVTSNGSNGSLGVHVLSASGNNIIAVANPALALSPTLVEPLSIKRENISMDEWWGKAHAIVLDRVVAIFD